MRLPFLSQRLGWILPAVLLGLVSMSAGGCDWLEEQAAATVKEETGLDINSPVQIAGAAAAGSVLGSAEQNDALAVLRGYRRAQHQQKGDEYLDQNKPALAREEYNKALQWTDTGSKAGKDKAAGLTAAISNSYYTEALNFSSASQQVNDPGYKADLERAARERYRLAASQAGKAADMHSAPSSKQFWYSAQATDLADAGDSGGACAAAKKADALAPASGTTSASYYCK